MRGNKTGTSGAGGRNREREREGLGVGPEGYVGAAPRPEAARHLGHPYIAKYSRVEKAPFYVESVFSVLLDQESVETRDFCLLVTETRLHVVEVR